MLFNSITFFIFFCFFFVVYYQLYKFRALQNVFILLASYIFYGWWDWRFLGLIFISSITDFFVGQALGKTENNRKRKLLLIFSISFNLGVLGFFKYFNFFVESFTVLLTSLGIQANSYSLSIILPIGISFYTFQTMSYTIDIYRNQLSPTNKLLDFMAFVSFFPQLVAGPIERATNLLPQFSSDRKFEYEEAKEGLKQVTWGLFKKLVIADNCAHFVNYIFANHQALSGSILVVGAILFAFQIYADFSGYSDIAIGLAGIMGFKLMQNFRSPYLALNIQDFWRRWHISLSTWFRDYVFIPLGGSKGVTQFFWYRNIFLTFVLSGLWHGANWTFLVWGALHAIYYFIQKSFSTKYTVATNWWKNIVYGLVTFGAVTFAWIFFRAESIGAAFSYIQRMATFSILRSPIKVLASLGISQYHALITMAMIIFMLILEYRNRFAFHNLKLEMLPVFKRYAVYFFVVTCLFYFRSTGENLDFIYFQF